MYTDLVKLGEILILFYTKNIVSLCFIDFLMFENSIFKTYQNVLKIVSSQTLHRKKHRDASNS